MGSLDDRVDRLAGRIKPPYEIPPEFHLSTRVLLKVQDADRRELDGLPPDPDLELTPDEEAFDRDPARAREWIAYLEGERDRYPPDAPMWGELDAVIRAEMAEDHDSRGGDE